MLGHPKTSDGKLVSGTLLTVFTASIVTAVDAHSVTSISSISRSAPTERSNRQVTRLLGHLFEPSHFRPPPPPLPPPPPNITLLFDCGTLKRGSPTTAEADLATMGLAYNTYLNSNRVYGCKGCKTHLANHDDIISRVRCHTTTKLAHFSNPFFPSLSSLPLLYFLPLQKHNQRKKKCRPPLTS